MTSSRAPSRSGSKIMTAAEAVARFVRPGSILGMGGQNIGRCPMALAHEIIRQRIGALTVVGCNLSIGMDQLAGAGLVRRTESGSGNLERFGTTFCWRRGIEQGTIEHEDYSHLAMVSRFLAGEMGVPFMPTRSLLGSDILARPSAPAPTAPTAAVPSAAVARPGKAVVIENPWQSGEPVALVPALRPDVSIVHVQRADPLGNIIIEGFATHEPEMIRASTHVIVSCEQIVSTDEIRANPQRTTVPFLYVDAVVAQPYGAYPTSTYGYYDYDPAQVTAYQDAARTGSPALDDYLREHVWGCRTFDEHLERTAGRGRLDALARAMQEMM
jgi:acyl CoA:acetate/3-ketoacid CoA transferase alpha subunit